jgi:tetratricopeptide repeat protein
MGVLGTSTACLALGLSVVGVGSAHAQTPTAPLDAGALERDTIRLEATRARTLARLERFDEALALLRDLLARWPTDPWLRLSYVETLADAGRLEDAAEALDRYLADEPSSAALRRLRARIDLERGRAQRAVETLQDLYRELPDEPGLAGDLAHAELRTGRWRRALRHYDDALAQTPDDTALQGARAELIFAYGPRVEVLHRTLLQEDGESHVEEVAWRGWVDERWWIRPAARYATYHGTARAGVRAFTEDVETAAVLVGVQPRPEWSARIGIDEARRDDVYRTTGRLGGAFDDRRTTRVDVDMALRELLTNPVAAVPLRGSTDRVTFDLWHALLGPVAAAVRYEYRHYRANGHDIGDHFEASARLEVGVVREAAIRVTIVPQVFTSEFQAAGPHDLREQVSFLRRQDIVATGLVVAWDPFAAVRLTGAIVGRRDVYRDVTSYELSGGARWRFRGNLELEGLYVRSSESLRIGGREETFFARVNILH